MKYYLIKVILLFLCFASVSIQAQNKGFIIPDSLKTKTTKELKNLFFKNYKNKQLARIYAKTILQLAKKEQDVYKIAEAYYRFAILDKDNAIVYLDSAIALDYKKADLAYPANAYFKKASLLSDYDTKNALNNYLLALQHATEGNNIYMQNSINHSIGLLKSRIGENKEALVIFKKCHAFYIKYNYRTEHNYSFLSGLFGLADAYQRNNKLDSASYYNKMGAKDAFLYKNKTMKTYFILNEGANHFLKTSYKIAIDSVTKSIPMLLDIEDPYNLGIAYFYLGESYFKLNKKEKGVSYLKKMDSMIKQTVFLMPEEREGYKILINYYKTKKDLKNQLVYTEKLIKADSLLQSYHKNLTKDLALKYDIPKLVKEKEALIKTLHKKVDTSVYYLFGLLVLLFLAIYYVYANYIKQITLKKRFDQLLVAIENNKHKKEVKITKKTELSINKETIDTILVALEEFETKLLFLETGITQLQLAKKMKTNSSYLSKVINHYKNKNFSAYLSDLRIDYAVITLKENRKLRNYTVKAIANEFGFNNAESFSTAFYKKTGIYPSFYIKQLEQ